jgi:two-component system sensor histidine kinase FlrB
MALAEISTILAHEIRNPLASMELFAGLIAEDPGQTRSGSRICAPGFDCSRGRSTTCSASTRGGSSRLAPVNLTACMRGGVEFVQPIAEQAA